MKIVIGNYADPTDSRNLILNDEVIQYKTGEKLSDHFAIITKIEGLETPPYRNGTGDWSGADGGYLSSQFYGARVITISGAYFDKNALCDVSSQNEFDKLARLYIRSRLPIRQKQDCRIFLDSQLTFSTEGYCTNLKMEYNRETGGEYQITFYCPDPMLYLAATDGSQDSEWIESTLYKEKSVGYVNPYELPVAWGTGGRSAPVDYDGDYAYYPQIIIPGPVVNPVIASTNTGQTFSLGASAENPTTIKVLTVNGSGAILTYQIQNAGAYDTNQSGNGLTLSGSSTSVGYGATMNVSMAQSGGVWSAASATLVNAGSGYQANEILTVNAPSYIPFSVASGQSVVIDMQNRTVTVDGVSRSYFINPGSEWIYLIPQTLNHIVFTSAGEDDVKYATIRWRTAYQGI